jgi:hypothetical protein
MEEEKEKGEVEEEIQTDDEMEENYSEEKLKSRHFLWILGLIMGIPVIGMIAIYVISTPLVWKHRADTVRAAWYQIASIKNPNKRRKAFEKWMKKNGTTKLQQQTAGLYELLNRLPLELLDPENPVRHASFRWDQSTRLPSHTQIIMGEDVEGKQHRHHYHLNMKFETEKLFNVCETDLKLAAVQVKSSTDHPKNISGPTFESLLWLAALLRLDDEEHLQEAFAALDLDGDGYITAQDLAADGITDSQQIQILLDRADKDHDGKISFQEFKSSLAEELAAD